MKLTTRVRLLLRRRHFYRALFLDEQGNLTEAGETVLADLARFACANTPTVYRSPITRTVDTHATMLREGRREAFNRITEFLNISESKIYAILEKENGNHEQ